MGTVLEVCSLAFEISPWFSCYLQPISSYISDIILHFKGPMGRMVVTECMLTCWIASVLSDSCPWNFPGKNTAGDCHFLLQRIFPTQRSNLCLLHCRRILYQLSQKGSPRILEWVAYPFSSRSSQPRNQTRISCIAGRFFTNWATREALMYDNLIGLMF